MGLAAWLVPMLLGLISTGVSAGVSASNTKKQIESQEEIQALQQKNANIAKTQEQASTYQQQLQKNSETVNNFKSNLITENTNIGSTNYASGMSVQGLNGQQGYLQEEDQTIPAALGGRFKRQFGGSNKTNTASLFVSPNNVNVNTNNNVDNTYRDRLAQLKFGGRKC